MDGSVDNLMDDQKAGRPQVDAQAAHSLPTTGYFDTTIICLFLDKIGLDDGAHYSRDNSPGYAEDGTNPR